jgi:hypothetical protein
MSRALFVLLLLLLPAGCGGGSPNSLSSSAPTALSITIWPKGTPDKSISYTLNCPEGTGSLPKARAACSKLKQLGAAAFKPVPNGTACTEIYGGPQTAIAGGRLAGKSIKAGFQRPNGCESARWDRLGFLFLINS